MPDEPKPTNPPSPIATACPSYTSILQEHDVLEKQKLARRELLRQMQAKEFNNNKTKNAVVAHIARAGMVGSGLDAGDDIPVLGNVLRSIGDVDVLNLILHSPGGDGTCVEKFVSLCRNQCETFRVIIPNMAKSAATMIALGADQIIMGPPSEIGPIDAQIPAIVEGVGRYISAQSFIDARDSLLERFNLAKRRKQDVRPILQMISTLDVPHIEECQRMMDFGRDVVRKLLSDYMFKGKNKNKRIEQVVRMLSSVKTHKVHGRIINGPTARSDLGLNVMLLAKDDKFWKIIWEYYTRAEIYLGNVGSAKMFETQHEVLTAQMAVVKR